MHGSATIAARSAVMAPPAGNVDFMTQMTLDVPEIVAEDEEGRSALQAAMTEAAIKWVALRHPDQLADVASRAVFEIDRAPLEAGGYHGA